MHKHLRRLECIWINSPIYFVTTCTKNRRQVLVAAGADRGGFVPDNILGGRRQRRRLQRLQNHALDVRVDVERRRTKKTDECLIALPRKTYRQCRRR